MKRILLLITLCFAIGSAKAYTPEICFGTRQGATMGFVWFYPTVNHTMLLGYTGGFTSRFILEKYFGLQVELNYMQRGWKANPLKSDPEGFKYQRTLHYVELPFMTHVFFGKQSFRWFFNLGLNLAYMAGDKTSTNLEPHEMRAEHTQPVARRFDYGICGGTGFEFHTRGGIYQLEGRYNFGLGDVFANRITDSFGRSSNQVISVSLGVLFDINKDKYKKQ